jgi:hypothetical protein
MNISTHHERVVAATPERVGAIIAGFDGIWPTHIAAAPGGGSAACATPG